MTINELEKYRECLKSEKESHRRAQIELKKLNRYIISVKDPVVRAIIINRYVKGKTWVATAMCIGGNMTEDNCRKILTRYIMKHGKK